MKVMNAYFTKFQSVFEHRYVNILILILISMSFVTTDMIISIVSISEIILIFLLPIIFIKTFKYVKKLDYKLILAIFFIITVNTVLNGYFNTTFLIRPAIAGAVKISFFTIFFFLSYRFIKHNNLKTPFLTILNITSLIVIVIGVYINIALVSKELSYEFFWTFLRTGYQSYTFKSHESLIRMRSLFNEPAHLGFYLNTILGVNLFQRVKEVPWYLSLTLIVGIIVTFSFSAVIILAIILGVFFLSKVIKNGFNIKRSNIIFAVILITIIIGLWEFIETSLILRVVDIIEGTDNSAYQRIVGSWQYISDMNIWTGLGIGNTPVIFNNYAYIMTEMGIIPFLLFVLLSLFILVNNFGLGVLLVLLNFQRGGYLSPSFTLSFLMIALFVDNKFKNTAVEGKE